MPSYDFKCPSCGLVFDAFVRDRATETYPCLDCGGDTMRSAVAAVNFVFGSGKVTGNTKVDSLDSSVDKAVGRNAAARWEEVKDRQGQKRQVKADNGGDGTPIRHNQATGEYEPMTKPEVDRFQRMHKKYDDIYKKHKQERESKGIPKFTEDK